MKEIMELNNKEKIKIELTNLQEFLKKIQYIKKEQNINYVKLELG
jgi:hypothetical protein